MSTPNVRAVPAKTGTIYNRVFWVAYAANVVLSTANALTFRFADFVSVLGGAERVTGSIVSVGLIAAIAARLQVGIDIDRFGTRRVWIASGVLFVAGSALFVLTGGLGWEIYVARIAFAVGLAGASTASMVFLLNQVLADRRTEVIGNMGTGGFVGMIVGTLLSDMIFVQRPSEMGMQRFDVLFGAVSLLGVLYTAMLVGIPRSDGRPAKRRTPSILRLLTRHWPGNVILIALMMGFSGTVTTVFLTRFASERNVGGFGTFFTSYCLAAFVARVLTGRLSHNVEPHWMVFLGLGGHAIGHAMLPLVHSPAMFIPPAIASGFGHGLLFPVVVALGSGSFPRRLRGAGTSIVLGFTEVGVVLAAPSLGWIIDHFGFTPMFLTSSATAVLIGVVYAVTTVRKPNPARLAAQAHPQQHADFTAPEFSERVTPDSKEPAPPTATAAPETDRRLETVAQRARPAS